jgi:hypothetical protein
MWKRMAIVVLITLGGLLALISPAWAKGPLAVRIAGPGLDKPILLNAINNPKAGEAINSLSEETGFWVTVFAIDLTVVDKNQLDARPAGELGPRYTIDYDIDSGTTQPLLRQDIYPFAPGGPVTYAPAEQQLFEGQVSRGGWYRAPAVLTNRLVALGVPEPKSAPAAKAAAAPEPAQPAAPTRATDTRILPIAAALALGLLAALAAVAWTMRRRATVRM